MKRRHLVYPLILGVLFLLLPACQGGGGGYAPPAAPQAAAPEQPTPPTKGYPMGPGRQTGYGMMQQGGQGYGMMAGGMGGGMMGGGMGGGMMEGQGYQGYQQQYRGRTGGAGLFANYCASCHPNGGNVMNPSLPVRGAPQLRSFSRFRDVVREGSGPMPSFSSDLISNSQMQELYRYVRSAFGG
jgi:mono/diheme cytochrome c family protein